MGKAKNRPSLEQLTSEVGQGTPAPAKPAKVVELHTPEKPAPAAQAVRKDRPHTTLYLDRKAQKVIKEIALQFDRKPHDLYLEGIELMLAHYGRPSLKELAE